MEVSLDAARQRIQSAIDQFGPRAAPMIETVISEVQSAHGRETANELIEEFDLELQYNITPIDPLESAD